MDLFALFTSKDGRLARGPFVWGVLAVYVAGFMSQALLSSQIMARAGMWPFVFVQAALIWAWLALHIKRLRDADEGPAGAIGVAVIYVLALGLLLLVVGVFTTVSDAAPARAPGEPLPPAQSLLALFVVLLVFGLLFSADFSVVSILIKILVVVALLPAFISFVFTVWTGTRPSAPPTPEPLPPR